MDPKPSKLQKVNNNDANKSTGRGQNSVLGRKRKKRSHTQRRGKSVPEGRGGGKDRTAGQSHQTNRPTNPYVASLYVRNRLRPCLISA